MIFKKNKDEPTEEVIEEPKERPVKIKFDQNSEVRIRVVEQDINGHKVLVWRRLLKDFSLGSINNPKVEMIGLETLDAGPAKPWFDRQF